MYRRETEEHWKQDRAPVLKVHPGPVGEHGRTVHLTRSGGKPDRKLMITCTDRGKRLVRAREAAEDVWPPRPVLGIRRPS